MTVEKSRKLEQVAAGVEALQNDQTRRNIEDEEVFTERQREAIKSIVHEALVDFFRGYGRLSKSIIIGTAVIFGSLTVILGGVKVILMWLGFSYLGGK